MLNLYGINIHRITKPIPVYFFPIDKRTLLNDPQVRSGGFLYRLSSRCWLITRAQPGHKKNVSFISTRKGFVQIFKKLTTQHSPGDFTYLACHADIPVLIYIYFQRSSLHMHGKITIDKPFFNENA